MSYNKYPSDGSQLIMELNPAMKSIEIFCRIVTYHRIHGIPLQFEVFNNSNTQVPVAGVFPNDLNRVIDCLYFNMDESRDNSFRATLQAASLLRDAGIHTTPYCGVCVASQTGEFQFHTWKECHRSAKSAETGGYRPLGRWVRI